MEREHAVRCSREALALLTASTSDMGLAEQLFATDLGTLDTAREAWEKATNQLIGMWNLSTRLLIALEEVSGRPRSYCLEALSKWLFEVETGGSTEQ